MIDRVQAFAHQRSQRSLFLLRVALPPKIQSALCIEGNLVDSYAIQFRSFRDCLLDNGDWRRQFLDRDLSKLRHMLSQFRVRNVFVGRFNERQQRRTSRVVSLAEFWVDGFDFSRRLARLHKVHAPYACASCAG